MFLLQTNLYVNKLDRKRFTPVKPHTVIKFLTVENVTPTEIYRRLKVVYSDDSVDRFTVNR